jgi:hypothetical protein
MNVYTIFTKTLIIFFCVTVSFFSYSQDNDKSLVSISGVVRDKKTGKEVEPANIFLSGSKIGTVSNEDGRFTLKIFNPGNEIKIDISHIGYRNRSVIITKENFDKEQAVFLEQSPLQLQEIVVVPEEASKLVLKAIENIKNNYSMNNVLMTGFYRETVQKRKRYINIAEAVINIYKSPYSYDISSDKIQILKGRSLLSPKQSDTLAIKLRGGPTLAVNCDFVKNKDFLFDGEIMNLYSFKLDNTTILDDREHFTIIFQPKFIMQYALYRGTLYIDKETFAFSRAEFNLDISNEQKATASILYKKPLGLRFKPEELSILITFKRHNDISYLNYVRNEIRFKCDWKKRLFATNYTVISESVVTDINENNIQPIANKDVFKSSYSLSDKVSDFYDENFWQSYNIIEPSESLENAVNKLKKSYK